MSGNMCLLMIDVHVVIFSVFSFARHHSGFEVKPVAFASMADRRPELKGLCIQIVSNLRNFQGPKVIGQYVAELFRGLVVCYPLMISFTMGRLKVHG